MKFGILAVCQLGTAMFFGLMAITSVRWGLEHFCIALQYLFVDLCYRI